MVISEIKKEHGVITFSFNDMDGRTVTLNVLDGTITSYTGKNISSMPRGLNQALNDYSMTTDRTAEKIRVLFGRYISSRNDLALKILDTYFSNLDLLDLVYYSLNDIPTTLPKGYVKYLRDNNLKATKKNLKKFNTEIRIKNWSDENKELYSILKEKASYYDELIELDDEKLFILLKILKVHMKTFSWRPQDELQNYLTLIFRTGYDENKYKWWEIADTNRGFVWNYDNFKNTLNAERNAKVMDWQKNFKEKVEQLSDDNLIVIVPTTQEQFADEGRQQNNCVGSYYHDSLAAHRNVIYFIRKKERPNKSYITNRYCIGDWTRYYKTTETRAVNNSDYSDKDVDDLIEKIDEVITSIVREMD